MNAEALQALMYLSGVGGFFCGLCLFLALLARKHRDGMIQLFGSILYTLCVLTHVLGALTVGACVVYVLIVQSPQLLFHLTFFALACICSLSVYRLCWFGLEWSLKKIAKTFGQSP